MCGQPLRCKCFLTTFCSNRVLSCVRPVYAAVLPLALMKSADRVPNQTYALKALELLRNYPIL